MHVLVDLGTTRTAIAVAGDRLAWGDLPSMDADARHVTERRSWGKLETLLAGSTKDLVLPKDIGASANPYLALYSRYCDIGGLILPVSIGGTEVRLPTGCKLAPEVDGPQFISIKQAAPLAQKFLGALGEFVTALAGQGAQWIVGRSAGGIDPRTLLPAGTRSYNEATAVIYALLAQESAALTDLEDRFVVVADLGGGFLDVALADNLHFAERSFDSRLVSFGGYPLGVDRVSERFSIAPVTGYDSLLRLICLAISYHIWAYRQHEDNAKRKGAVILTGGGFQRIIGGSISAQELREMVASRLPQDVAVEVSSVDTKYLTLAGLRALAVSDQGQNVRELGTDISGRDPHHYGREVLSSAGRTPGSAQTWYALLEDLRRDEIPVVAAPREGGGGRG